ncbi:hypothetical protein GCM10010321_75790 [Streptomyces chartreusis]|nr:hypothetical protein GCM10010321_75790 [Streptomyces chartreusis]
MMSPTATEGWADGPAEAPADDDAPAEDDPDAPADGSAGAVLGGGVEGLAVGFVGVRDVMTARPVFLSYEATLREDFFAPPPPSPSATAVGVAAPDGADTTASCSWAAAGPGLSEAVEAAASVVAGVSVEQPVVSTAARAIADSTAWLLTLGLCTRVPRERCMGVRCRR